jgi:hypothetical protein
MGPVSSDEGNALSDGDPTGKKKARAKELRLTLTG